MLVADGGRRRCLVPRTHDSSSINILGKHMQYGRNDSTETGKEGEGRKAMDTMVGVSKLDARARACEMTVQHTRVKSHAAQWEDQRDTAARPRLLLPC